MAGCPPTPDKGSSHGYSPPPRGPLAPRRTGSRPLSPPRTRERRAGPSPARQWTLRLRPGLHHEGASAGRVCGAEHHSEEVHLHDSPPSPGGRVREVRRLHTPSVVHQNVEPSDFLLRASDQVPHIRCARHVRQHREGASPSAPDLIRDSPYAIPIDVGNNPWRRSNKIWAGTWAPSRARISRIRKSAQREEGGCLKN
jgi:hypothetical protein